MVVDTSFLLTIYLNEEHATWAATFLQKHKSRLLMSTVNLCELHILLRDKRPQSFEEVEESLNTLSINYVPPTAIQAITAAEARIKFPINLGDCFAYALAKSENCPILTLDRGFRKTDIKVILP